MCVRTDVCGRPPACLCIAHEQDYQDSLAFIELWVYIVSACAIIAGISLVSNMVCCLRISQTDQWVLYWCWPISATLDVLLGVAAIFVLVMASIAGSTSQVQGKGGN